MNKFKLITIIIIVVLILGSFGLASYLAYKKYQFDFSFSFIEMTTYVKNNEYFKAEEKCDELDYRQAPCHIAFLTLMQHKFNVSDTPLTKDYCSKISGEQKTPWWSLFIFSKKKYNQEVLVQQQKCFEYFS